MEYKSQGDGEGTRRLAERCLRRWLERKGQTTSKTGRTKARGTTAATFRPVPVPFPYPEQSWSVGTMRKAGDATANGDSGVGADEGKGPDDWKALQQQARSLNGRLMVGLSEKKAFDATDLPINEAIQKLGVDVDDPECKEATATNAFTFFWCQLQRIGAQLYIQHQRGNKLHTILSPGPKEGRP